MAEYHSLIARAVSGLESNTGEARRALYERARVALVKQLREATPALGESEVTRERLALEEAIRKVEAEQHRRVRLDHAPAAPQPAPPPPSEAADAGVAAATAEPAEVVKPTEAPESSAASVPAEQEPSPEPAQPPAAAPEPVEMTELPPAEPPSAGAVPPAEEQASPAAAVPEPPELRLTDYDRPLFPRSTPSGRTTAPPPMPEPSESAEPADRAPSTHLPIEASDHAPIPPEPVEAAETFAGPEPHAADIETHALPQHVPTPARRSGAALKVAIAVIVLAVLAAVAAVGYRQRGHIAELYQALNAPPPSTVKPAQPQTKTEDRVAAAPGAHAPGTAGRGEPASAEQPPPAVAQRVVLYEEEQGHPNGKRFVGSVVWQTPTVSPGAGLPPELAVKATVEVPERQMTMTLQMVRNTDPTLPASHTIDIRFKVPKNFAGGGISSVPGILMKQNEQARGVPLAGLSVKVMENVFLIGLSAIDTDVQRNTELLRARPWFDIPIVYANGARAILAIEKGIPGERAFKQAFAAWAKASSAKR